MDCELFLVSNLDNETLKNTIYNILCEVVKDKVTIYESFSRLSCRYFTIDIETEDITGIDFIREEYKLEINAEIRIQLFGQTFNEGLEVLFYMIGDILSISNPDMVFVENGTDQLFRKENDIVIVNTNLDQYQKKYLSKKLINSLKYPYIERDLCSAR
ncbi:hypothetical protein JCM16418A_38410 [Paenibacillus pini]|uniref:hypothetical protein n=1 Tax=Paenibacillus pini TaxID=669461 RepID=UPI0005625E55|nr:hypothetical protein [Paenibacillus pini]